MAPRFSPDGRWLSYISPSTNSIQIYNLRGDQSLSISARYAMPDIWSPNGDSLLFWDTNSQDIGSIARLEKYDLASGQITDLGGPNQQDDYDAAWSPDGQRIAIARKVTDSDTSKSRQQIILTRSDGSLDRILLDQTDYTYNDLSWSPDGQYLMYSRYSNQNAGGPDIWFADIQTGKQTQIVSKGKQAIWLP